MTIQIQPLCADDRSRWGELWASYLQFYGIDLPPAITEATWRRLMDPQDQPYGFAALDAEQRIVGIAHYHFHLSTWSIAGYCYLEDLFVEPAARGHGAGRALIEAVFRAADERGAPRVYWHTESDNLRAQELYSQFGVLVPLVQYRRR